MKKCPKCGYKHEGKCKEKKNPVIKMKLLLILTLFFSALTYCPPKLDKQASNLDVIEKNYNKFAYISGGLLLTSAALNHNRLMLLAHSYYIQVSPYFTQSNLGKASLAGGLLLAAPLLYLKLKENK